MCSLKAEEKFHMISHQDMLTNTLHDTHKIHNELLKHAPLLDACMFVTHVTIKIVLDRLVGERALLLAGQLK